MKLGTRPADKNLLFGSHILIPSFLTASRTDSTMARWCKAVLASKPRVPTLCWITPIFYGPFLMRQFMSGIPTDLIQASRIDGCSEFGIFTRIILPLSKPALSALGIFTFMWNWDSFLWPLVVVDSERCKTLPIALAMFTGQYFTQYELVMAASTIAVLPVLLVFFAFQRQIIEGITLTGIKG